jgi:hypothetical protein
MKYATPEQLRATAELHDQPLATRMDRSARLTRWADILEEEPRRLLRSLAEMEFVSKAERPFMRADESALTVAFQDPLFRELGLKSDRLGDAMEFFDLSEHDAHVLLCSCHNGYVAKASTIAGRVRGMTGPGRIRTHVIGFAIMGATAAGLPILALLI